MLDATSKACPVCACMCCVYRIPASQLATPSHVEVQIVFKGQMPEGHIQWDNNEGNNWQVWVPSQLRIALSAAMHGLQIGTWQVRDSSPS